MDNTRNMKAWTWTEATFDAAHQLPLHEGKCRRLHGHTYKVVLGIEVEIDNTTGMAVDFGVLQDFLHIHAVAPYDHKLLNDVLFGRQPTAENIALEILGQAVRVFKCPARVRVHETPSCWVEVRSNGRPA